MIKKLRYRLEWIAVKVAFGLFRLLGMKNASALGGWLTEFFGRFLLINSVAQDNLRQAFPQLSDEETNQIIKRMWNTIGRNFAEFQFLRDLRIDGENVMLEGEEYLDQIRNSDKGSMAITAHYGQWELLSALYLYADLQVTPIYRAANNPMVNEIFQKYRSNANFNWVPKGREGARAMLKGLKQGRVVTTMNDQKLNNGMAVPFFGRDAMTATAIAEFTLKLDVPIYPVRVERLDDLKFRIVVSAPIPVVRTGDKTDDVKAVLLALNKEYENWITAHPEQWFWVHKRWPQ